MPFIFTQVEFSLFFWGRWINGRWNLSSASNAFSTKRITSKVILSAFSLARFTRLYNMRRKCKVYRRSLLSGSFASFMWIVFGHHRCKSNFSNTVCFLKLFVAEVFDLFNIFQFKKITNNILLYSRFPNLSILL